MLAQIIEPGVVFRRVYFFTSGVLVERDDSLARLTAIFFVYSAGLTVLAMLTSEICAWAMRPASQIVHPVCSPGFIVNNIPFFTLNICIVLAIVLQVVAAVFGGFLIPFWLTFSAVATTILVTNKLAMKHVASRLRQQIDSFTIGGNNTVHPAVSIAVLPLRSLAGEAPTLARPTRPATTTTTTTRPANNTVGSIELQPLRVRTLTRDTPILPTPDSATLCPVGD